MGASFNIVKRGADSEVVAIKNGVETILVCHSDEIVFVISTAISCDGNPFVKYLHFCENSDAAHDKFLYLIGDMLLKYPDSKYFNKPKVSEHMYNGLDGKGMSDEQYNKLVKASADAKSCYVSYCDERKASMYI